MVKNSNGGNKAKGMARKFAGPIPTNTTLRLSENEFEVYAQVIKLFGNNMCNVLCQDGIVRMCHIRGKFRGRNKKSNLLVINSWILVGLREYERKSMETNESIKNCDLEEIYSEDQKERLKSADPSVRWKLFIANDNKIAKMSTIESASSAFTDPRKKHDPNSNKIVKQDFEMPDIYGEEEEDNGDFAFVDDETYHLQHNITTSKSNIKMKDNEETIDIDDI